MSKTFLKQAFPTWDMIEFHREVVRFACGILGDTYASCIVNHAARVLVEHINNQLETGHAPLIFMGTDKSLPLLALFQQEGNLQTRDIPYITEYPACGHNLIDILLKYDLVYISYINTKDTLQLIPSPTQILVKLQKIKDAKKFDRLWKALHLIHSNTIGLLLDRVMSENVTKLYKFSQLKFLYISECYFNEAAAEDLAKSIEAWGPQPQLTYCSLHTEQFGIPDERMSISLLTAICKCRDLVHLSLTHTLTDRLYLLIGDPPPNLRHLTLRDCWINRSDVNRITQAIRKNLLTKLRSLDLTRNPVGEEGIGSLLETFILTRAQTGLTLHISSTGSSPCEYGEFGEYVEFGELSEEFIAEWKPKVRSTDIIVFWKSERE